MSGSRNKKGQFAKGSKFALKHGKYADGKKPSSSELYQRYKQIETSASRQKRLAKQYEYQSVHRKQVNEWRREHRKKNKPQYYAYSWKHQGINISLEQYQTATLQQKGKCAICENEMDKPHVDHCHRTNKFRGLLCKHCNLGLGHFKDDVELLLNAIDYLERTRRGTE